MFGLLPPAYERFRALYGSLWNPDVLDPTLLELCRLRIAAVLGCESEARVRFRDAMEAGLTEEKIAALPRYTSAPELSERERSCIAFAEQYVLDPHGLDDSDFARLRASLDSKQIATLTLAVAVFDALARFRLALGILPPETTSIVAGPGRAPETLP